MSLLPAADLWLDFFRQVALLKALYLRSSDRTVLLSEGGMLMQDLHRIFQSQILPQSGSPAMPDPIQRYLTETHRLLRLLSTDFSLYRAARAEALQQQRLKGICDRLESLSAYGEAIELALQNLSEPKV
jgi:hypothetical protein